MVKITSDQDLITSFRSFEQKKVEIPRDLKYPFLLRDYMAWEDISGHRTYLVFRDQKSDKPMGIIFTWTHGTESVPAMCDWCHSVRGRGEVSLLTATVDRKRRIGLHLCRDLSCKEKLKGLPGVNDMRESIDSFEKVSRLMERITNFAHRSLF